MATLNIGRQKNTKQTLFLRMLVTCIVLTIVTSTAIALSSLMIYEDFYIKTVNENVREGIANNHENLVDQINGVRDDIVGSIFMQQYGLVPQVLDGGLDSDNYVEIKEIYDYLNQLVLQNSTYVNGVHIYYKANNVLISSKYGLKLLDSHNGTGIELDWLELMLVSDVHSEWLPTREVSSSSISTESNYSYVTTYPMTHSSKDAQIMICIDFDEEMLHQRLNGDSRSINYILDGKGSVISLPEGMAIKASTEERFSEPEGYFLEEINGEDYLFSYIRESSNNWLLVNQYPTRGLYETLDTIKWTVVVIYLVIMAIGIIASFMITSRLYNPVRDLMNTIRQYKSDSEGGDDGDISAISNVINGLGGHISELQDTIESSRGLLLTKFIGDLSRKSGLTREEIRERMDFLGISLNKSGFMFMKVEISYLAANELKPSQAQIIKYRLINEINQMSDDNSTLLATDYEDNSILVLINTDFSTNAFKRIKLNDLVKIESIFSAEVFIRIFLLDSVSDIRELHQSYKQLDELKQIIFYKPADQLLTSQDLPQQDSVMEFDRGKLEKFEQLLYSGGEEIYDEVDSVMEEVLKPVYAMGQKQTALINLIRIVAKYIKDVSLNSHDIMDDNIYDLFNSTEDINMFRQWLVEIIGKVHDLLNDTNSSAHNDTIVKVKAYIEEHMDEDLSLSLVAGNVYLSPQYLSTLFKKEVGLNFSTYLQRLRMERARKLLLETEMKVEAVGVKVGYNTSHYFIKKFKENTGLTPRQYRNRHTKI